MLPSKTPRSDEQQNPFGSEQENPRGGYRSSVAVGIAFLMPVGSGWSLTVITQVDIEAGASQNSSGRIANSYNTTARDTTSNCGNTTTTNSNNTTTDTSRAYKKLNHNELKVIGPVGNCSPVCSVLRRGNYLADTQRFCLGNTTNYYMPQPRPTVNTQTREDLEKFGRLEEAVT